MLTPKLTLKKSSSQGDDKLMSDGFSASLLFRYRTGDNQWGVPLCETRKYFASSISGSAFDFFDDIGRKEECDGCFYKGVKQISELDGTIPFLARCGPFGVDHFYAFGPKLKAAYIIQAFSDEVKQPCSRQNGKIRPYHAKLLFKESKRAHRDWPLKHFAYMYFVFQGNSVIEAIKKSFLTGIDFSKYGWGFCGIDEILDGSLLFNNKVDNSYFDYWFDLRRTLSATMPLKILRRRRFQQLMLDRNSF